MVYISKAGLFPPRRANATSHPDSTIPAAQTPAERTVSVAAPTHEFTTLSAISPTAESASTALRTQSLQPQKAKLETSPSSINLSQLPSDVLINIFDAAQMTPRENVRLQLTCKRFCETLRDNFFWRRLLEGTWELPRVGSFLPPAPTEATDAKGACYAAYQKKIHSSSLCLADPPDENCEKRAYFLQRVLTGQRVGNHHPTGHYADIYREKLSYGAYYGPHSPNRLMHRLSYWQANSKEDQQTFSVPSAQRKFSLTSAQESPQIDKTSADGGGPWITKLPRGAIVFGLLQGLFFETDLFQIFSAPWPFNAAFFEVCAAIQWFNIYSMDDHGYFGWTARPYSDLNNKDIFSPRPRNLAVPFYTDREISGPLNAKQMKMVGLQSVQNLYRFKEPVIQSKDIYDLVTSFAQFCPSAAPGLSTIFQIGDDNWRPLTPEQAEQWAETVRKFAQSFPCLPPHFRAEPAIVEAAVNADPIYFSVANWPKIFENSPDFGKSLLLRWGEKDNIYSIISKLTEEAPWNPRTVEYRKFLRTMAQLYRRFFARMTQIFFDESPRNKISPEQVLEVYRTQVERLLQRTSSSSFEAEEREKWQALSNYWNFHNAESRT